jgi:hypothetical protein
MAATSEMARSRKASDHQLWVCKDRRGCKIRITQREPEQLRLSDGPGSLLRTG